MAYQEVTKTSYGSRLGNSLRGIITGLILFVAATALLWWNEGRAVKTSKMLKDSAKECVDVADVSTVDPALNGKLIHATAVAKTDEILTDPDYGVSVNAIRLVRNVEYYQWVEHAQEKKEDKLGGKEVTTTTYTYTKEWVSRPIESAQFKDPAYQKKNMVLTTVEDAEQYAENVSWGAYQLNENLIHRISSSEGVDLALAEDLLKQFDKSTQTAYERFYGVQKNTQQPAQQPAISDSVKALLPDSVKAVLDSLQAVNDSINKAMEAAENKKDLEYVHQANNVLYFGRVPGSPEVGDVRVTFEKVVPAKVTVMAVVDGNTFKPFKAKNGKRFQTLVMGQKSGDEIIDAEKEANNMILWFLRIVGILMVIGGLKGIFGFIETIFKVVPFVAGIFGWGIGIVCTVIGIAWSLIVIAIAWLFYRPLLGISLLVLAGFLIWVFAFKGKDKLKELASGMKKDKQLNPVREN